MANGLSEEQKAKMAAGRAAAKARREQEQTENIEITASGEPVSVLTCPIKIEYSGYTIEVEQPDRVMVCKDTTVREQWYGNIDECVAKAREYIDGQEA